MIVPLGESLLGYGTITRPHELDGGDLCSDLSTTPGRSDSLKHRVSRTEGWTTALSVMTLSQTLVCNTVLVHGARESLSTQHCKRLTLYATAAHSAFVGWN
eukprot:5024024-Amphidinium_carterae.1